MEWGSKNERKEEDIKKGKVSEVWSRKMQLNRGCSRSLGHSPDILKLVGHPCRDIGRPLTAVMKEMSQRIQSVLVSDHPSPGRVPLLPFSLFSCLWLFLRVTWNPGSLQQTNGGNRATLRSACSTLRKWQLPQPLPKQHRKLYKPHIPSFFKSWSFSIFLLSVRLDFCQLCTALKPQILPISSCW